MSDSQKPQGQVPPPPPAAPDPDPETMLAQIQKSLADVKQSLQDNQAQSDALTKSRDALATRAGTLAQSVDDGKKILAAYAAAFPGLDADDKSFVKYDHTKMCSVQVNLSADRLARIDGIIGAYDKDVDAKKADADRLAQAAADARAASDKARADNQAAQDDYNTLKAIQKGLADKDTASKKLMAEIDGYEAKKNYEAMYYRLKDFERGASDFHNSILTVDSFKKDVDTVVLDLDDTWQKAQAKKQAAEAAAAQAATAKAAYDAAVARRTAELLKQIAALPPAPPPAPPPQVTTPAPPQVTTPPPPSYA